MAQLPTNQTSADSGPDDFEGKVLSYWNNRMALLEKIPDPETRQNIIALLDGRVSEHFVNNLPPHMQTNNPRPFDLPDTLADFRLIHSNSPQWTDIFLRDAVPYIGVVYYRYMQTPEVQKLLKDWDDQDSVVTVVLAAAAPWLAIQGLAIVGFTASGVAAGSLAALWQSTIGNVVAGSLFSTFQSFGALGALGPWGLVASAAGAGVYGVYKLASQPSNKQRFDEMILTLLQDDAKRNDFWASIRV